MREEIGIRLSNGRWVKYVAASGTLGFSGKGWVWYRFYRLFGLVDPLLFTIVTKTLTRYPRRYPVSNLSWIRPWTWLPWSRRSCIRYLGRQRSMVNKVGLENKGIEWWCKEVAPFIDFTKYQIVVSLHGTVEELLEMVRMLESFDIVGIELNVSCPNTREPMAEAGAIVTAVRTVKPATRHPLILKLSVAQKYLEITRQLAGIVEAIDLNSVPWDIVFKDASPVAHIGQEGSGNGGVSGAAAQEYNWTAVRQIAKQGLVPVIAPSIIDFDNIRHVRSLGAQAVSFGFAHTDGGIKGPCGPTKMVHRDLEDRLGEAA